jgi:hypothetical protein
MISQEVIREYLLNHIGAFTGLVWDLFNISYIHKKVYVELVKRNTQTLSTGL